nr:immunoglobulin heavy chain junction region [Macaca mulatta]
CVRDGYCTGSGCYAFPSLDVW